MTEPAVPKSLDDYYARIARRQLAPLWERLAKLVPPEPEIAAVPYLWDYDDLRPILLESAELITEEEAERRVLILENPGLSGQSAVTNTLFAGFQLIMPGEIAPSHRHTPSALRFIIEGQDAYTSVNGERADMTPGDLILTPSWCWHDHGHEGQDPVVWLDVLDIPLLKALGPRFVEHNREQRELKRSRPDENLHCYGMNMAPVDSERSGDTSPIRYPFDRARETLEKMKAHNEWDESLGLKMEYIDPMTGVSVMPTLSAFLQLLPSGFSGTRYQCSEGAVYSVVSGRGSVTVGTGENRETFSYKPNDVFAIPCWYAHAFAATEESVLFSTSDRGLQTQLGIWRERRS
jgi:gentisate 1,2-dioxygenase